MCLCFYVFFTHTHAFCMQFMFVFMQLYKYVLVCLKYIAYQLVYLSVNALWYCGWWLFAFIMYAIIFIPICITIRNCNTTTILLHSQLQLLVFEENLQHNKSNEICIQTLVTSWVMYYMRAGCCTFEINAVFIHSNICK